MRAPARQRAVAIQYDRQRGEMAKRYDAVYLDDVGSTQDEARDRFARGDGRPLMVAAPRQGSGRGRSGHGWLNAPRAVAVSIAFAPSWAPAHWPRLALVGGLAALDAAGPVGLKWPNDLWQGAAVGGVKVGGILSEASGGVVVIGMGLNLWWPDPPAGMGAVHDSDPGAGSVRRAADRWVEAMLRRTAVTADRWGREEYRAACTTLDHVVEWEDRATGATATGTAVDIGEDGELVVVAAGRRVALRSAGVRTVRATTLPATGREPR